MGWDNENYGETQTPLTLYYGKGVHIGTWCKGQGWVFGFAYDTAEMEKQVKQMAALDKILKDEDNA